MEGKGEEEGGRYIYLPSNLRFSVISKLRYSILESQKCLPLSRHKKLMHKIVTLGHTNLITGFWSPPAPFYSRPRGLCVCTDRIT